MELIFWRHAEAEEQGDFPDRERKLTSTGKKQARKVARFLRTRLPKDAILYSSPAVRCIQTISALGRPYQISQRADIDAPVCELLELADWHSESLKKQTVLICSHQPLLGQAISQILSGQMRYWTVKKGSIWWLSSRNRDQDSTAWVRAVITPGILDR